jgi:hypothetical protein
MSPHQVISPSLHTHTPRSKMTEQLDQSASSVLDSAAATLSPFALDDVHNQRRRAPVGRSGVTSPAMGGGRRTSLLLSIPNTMSVPVPHSLPPAQERVGLALSVQTSSAPFRSSSFCPFCFRKWVYNSSHPVSSEILDIRSSATEVLTDRLWSSCLFTYFILLPDQ